MTISEEGQATAAARKQSWNSRGYSRHARFVSDLAGDLLDWLDAQRNEQILDLGCGDGVLGVKIEQTGAQVTAIDMSRELLAVARKRGLNARYGDGQELDYEAQFDAVFSNAALHWMTRPKRVVRGVYNALKPGGRFVAEFGGHGNVAAIVTAMRAVGQGLGGDISLAGPWFFPTCDQYRDLLEAEGFDVRRIGLFPRPTALPTGIEGWLQTFRKPFFDQFDEPERSKAITRTVELLRPALCDVAGNWTADYVRLRVVAFK